MQRSIQEMYTELVAGKSVKTLLKDCLLAAKNNRSKTHLFATINFNTALNAAIFELNKNTISDHDAILNALLKLSVASATLLGEVLTDFLTLFPIYRPLVRFSINTPSFFDTFAQTALDQFCWDRNYFQAAECFSTFIKQIPEAERAVHKQRFLVGLANTANDAGYRQILVLLPHFLASFTVDELQALSAYLVLNFGARPLLTRERIIGALGLLADRLPLPEFTAVTHFLSLHLTDEKSPQRIRIAAFSALMQNIIRLEAKKPLLALQLLWLTKNNLAYQVVAFEMLHKLAKLPLTDNERQALFEHLYNALSSHDKTLFAAGLNAFVKLSKTLGDKYTFKYLKRAIDLYDAFNDEKKALFLATLPQVDCPEELGERLGELVHDYAQKQEGDWLYPVIALFHKTNSYYTLYWKTQFKQQTTPRKITDCQLFKALCTSIDVIGFATVITTLQQELKVCTDIHLVTCIAETLAACKGRLSNQQYNAFIPLLLPHLANPAAEDLPAALVDLLSGSEPPERYQVMAVMHAVGTKSAMVGFLKLNGLQHAFQLEQVLPLSPRQKSGH